RDAWQKDGGRVVFSLQIRQRIRDCWVQANSIAVQRVKDAEREADLASFGSLAGELASVSDARKHGTGADIRGALLAVATTCVLLAERQDRPSEPKRGTKRASTERWRPVAFGV
ncbi:MAG: hypothetical protein H0W36_12905, partial [Gemmatimonadetes bacterium]|nr:hypothetical protein [Gemmatimonadota bacterium]